MGKESGNVKGKGDTVKVWTLVDYFDEPFLGAYRSVKELTEFQCKSQMWRVLEITLSIGAMGGGERKGGAFKEPEWKNVEASTLQGEKWKIVCRND